MRAMILAAGLGTRLRPYTLVRPKPLFPILGRPLLLITIDKLRLAGFSPIIVNCHHLSEQIVDILKDEDDIILQVETEVLGTGGGLRKALESCGQEPLLVTNGDIYHNIPYDKIYAKHQESGCQVSMVMHDLPRFNKVHVDQKSTVQGFSVASFTSSSNDTSLMAFTGIHVVDPQVLRSIPSGCFYNIIKRYDDYISQGGQLNAIQLQNILWHDIGTPCDYLRLHAELIHHGHCLDNLQNVGGSSFYSGPYLQLGRNVTLGDWGFLGSGVSIGDNVSLTRVVVWDGATIPPNSVMKDTIIY